MSLNSLLNIKCGCSSVVERQLPKLNAVGSSPITRSRFWQIANSILQMVKSESFFAITHLLSANLGRAAPSPITRSRLVDSSRLTVHCEIINKGIRGEQNILLLLIFFICLVNLAGCASSSPIVKKNTYTSSDIPHHYVENDFIWPLKGRVVAFYGIRDREYMSNGIDIQPPGDESYVLASRQGRVIFTTLLDKNSDSPKRSDKKQLAKLLKYFGHTVILDHEDGFFTLYANNSDILVREGDLVNQGAFIARVGKINGAKNSYLHFEIRKGSKPQNPFYFLP